MKILQAMLQRKLMLPNNSGDICEEAKKAGAQGIVFVRVTDDGVDGAKAVKENLTPEQIEALKTKTGAQTGDLIIFGAGKWKIVNASLSRVRVRGEQATMMDL